jgi:exopolysaccharide biosynthesis protein
MHKIKLLFILMFFFFFIKDVTFAQQKWINVDGQYQPIPSGIHIYKTTESLDGKAFIAFYVAAELKDKNLVFDADTAYHRRLTPKQFYEKNNQPLVVVNACFFNFDKNQNLNAVIKDGKLVAYNNHTIPLSGKVTFQYKHPLVSAIGIDKNRRADIAWLYTDSSKRYAYATQQSEDYILDTFKTFPFQFVKSLQYPLHKWKMKTAVGGGPVLVQDGKIKISNEEELKFSGKAINDKHPRTCIGYTFDGKLIIMTIQGRQPGIAEGATLEQEAKLLIGVGCKEAMNLDGGGSSSMLINGKETIKPSDKEGARPTPSVFIIKNK